MNNQQNMVELIKYKQKLEIIPDWIIKGKYEVSLDKYYTYPNVAEYCYKSLLEIAQKHNININDYVFLEPSAGDGAFFNLLPKERRIGIDIEPEGKEIIKKDFFDWKPDKDRKYITIGNPPFGLRGWLALAFINRASEFSDLVGFILPMYFDSEGKGSAKSRVKGLYLLHSEELPSNIFHNGTPVKINTVWQVWGKIKNKKRKVKTCDSFVDVYTVCTYPSRRCGLDKLEKYDLFIPSTFYKKIKLSKNFVDITYGSGSGIIIKKNKLEMEKCLNNVDWFKYSIRATNHCRHIGIKHIKQALIDSGFVDEK